MEESGTKHEQLEGKRADPFVGAGRREVGSKLALEPRRSGGRDAWRVAGGR